MLAFLGPMQIMFLLLVLLIIFGPQKLPEIGQQLGRALRELRRAGQELTNSMNLDDRYEPTYDPPRYDGYGSSYNDYSDSNSYSSSGVSSEGPKPLPAQEKPRGDAAASALAEPESDYTFSTPEGSVPRNKS
jgi:TatA/E family protein of Tat protein translocase